MKIDIDGRKPLEVHQVKGDRRNGRYVLEGYARHARFVEITLSGDEYEAILAARAWEEFDAYREAIGDLRRTRDPWPWSQ